jgi:hypothetical protein
LWQSQKAAKKEDKRLMERKEEARQEKESEEFACFRLAA